MTGSLGRVTWLAVITLGMSLSACSQYFPASPDSEREAGISEGVEQSGPEIDGKIESQEWEAASLHHFEDGSELFLMTADKHLFVAIRAVEPVRISSNVFLGSDEGVAVLHTSAALGTLLYEKDGTEYRKAEDFVWCCRSRFESEASRLAREDFYTADGWLGANSFLGNENELEYKISLADQPAWLAVNFIYADGGENKQVWPVGLLDGVELPLSGGFPEVISFSLQEWTALEKIP